MLVNRLKFNKRVDLKAITSSTVCARRLSVPQSLVPGNPPAPPTPPALSGARRAPPHNLPPPVRAPAAPRSPTAADPPASSGQSRPLPQDEAAAASRCSPASRRRAARGSRASRLLLLLLLLLPPARDSCGRRRLLRSLPPSHALPPRPPQCRNAHRPPPSPFPFIAGPGLPTPPPPPLRSRSAAYTWPRPAPRQPTCPRPAAAAHAAPAPAPPTAAPQRPRAGGERGGLRRRGGFAPTCARSPHPSTGGVRISIALCVFGKMLEARFLAALRQLVVRDDLAGGGRLSEASARCQSSRYTHRHKC